MFELLFSVFFFLFLPYSRNWHCSSRYQQLQDYNSNNVIIRYSRSVLGWNKCPDFDQLHLTHKILIFRLLDIYVMEQVFLYISVATLPVTLLQIFCFVLFLSMLWNCYITITLANAVFFSRDLSVDLAEIILFNGSLMLLRLHCCIHFFLTEAGKNLIYSVV